MFLCLNEKQVSLQIHLRVGPVIPLAQTAPFNSLHSPLSNSTSSPDSTYSADVLWIWIIRELFFKEGLSCHEASLF